MNQIFLHDFLALPVVVDDADFGHLVAPPSPFLIVAFHRPLHHHSFLVVAVIPLFFRLVEVWHFLVFIQFVPILRGVPSQIDWLQDVRHVLLNELRVVLGRFAHIDHDDILSDAAADRLANRTQQFLSSSPLAISISQQQSQQQCFRRHSVDVPQFQTPDSLRRCAELVEQSLDRNLVFDHRLILNDLLHGYEG